MKKASIHIFKYSFERYKSYTSYTGLDAATAKAIEDSNYDNFPTDLVSKDGEVLVSDLEESYRLCDIVTSAGYRNITDTIKVRITTLSKSPDYDKPNGNGHCHQRMDIRSYVPLRF